jgi:hypothetical protein
MAYQKETRGVRRARASKDVGLAVDVLEDTLHPIEVQVRWLAARMGLNPVRARVIAELAFQQGGAS